MTERIRIEAHGQTAILKKAEGGNAWSLKVGSRARFGNWPEIEADLLHFLGCGNLPSAAGGWQ